jgi:hypothetical protein
MKVYKKTIILIVFNRPDKTKQTLVALKNINKIEQFNLIVIRQEGSEEVKRLIDDISWAHVTHHVTKFDKESSVKYRINFNVRSGIASAFENIHCNYVVVLEDDILLGYDFLHFCDVMHERYAEDPKFRAINAFSKEPHKKIMLWSYGKFRYGVGKGWSISRDSWQKLENYWELGIDEHFDYLIEGWTREGFVIMPHCSRSLDIGWGEDSSHGPKDEFHEHWVAMRGSWVGCDTFPIEEYKEVDRLPFSWREDCVPYEESFTQLLELLKVKSKILFRKFLKKLEKS